MKTKTTPTRLTLLLVFALLVAPSGVRADDNQPEAPEWPKPVSNVDQVLLLDPATSDAYVKYGPGVLAALAERCPGLERLAIECHNKIALDELKALRKLSWLRELVLGGDMGFPTTHFEIVGNLKTLRSLRLGLP